MAEIRVPIDQLEGYFDNFSSIMPTELVEIEVAALELGDQIGAEWVPLSGITYDPASEEVVVDVDGGKAQHTVKRPQEVVVDEDDDGIHSITIRCGEGHLHILRLKEPKAMPHEA